MPRKGTGIVPERWRRRAEAPFGNAATVLVGLLCTEPMMRWVKLTVDVGLGRERGVMRKRLGYIVVGSVHIVIFLWAEEQQSSASVATRTDSKEAWSRHHELVDCHPPGDMLDAAK